MRAGRVYMHPNCQDVCMQIVKADDTQIGLLMVEVLWLNLGYTGKPWIVDSGEYYLSNANEWRDITSLMFNPRTQPGLPV